MANCRYVWSNGRAAHVGGCTAHLWWWRDRLELLYTDNFDDPGKILALSTATALATPFEDHFVRGAPLISTALKVVDGELRAWSGVQLGPSHWIVLTPGKEGRTQPSNVTITLAVPRSVGKYIACDVTTGQTHHVMETGTGLVAIRAALSRTTVAQLSHNCCARDKLIVLWSTIAVGCLAASGRLQLVV